MRHAVARPAVIALIVLAGFAGAFVPASCAHLNSPGGTLTCMEDSKDEKAAEQLVLAMLDQDSTAALDAAFILAPDLVKCLLQKAASAKSAGGVAGERAKKAQRYLDAHGLSSLTPAVTPDVPERGICPWGNCDRDSVVAAVLIDESDSTSPGIGPGAGGG
jgi:hypothetical protein